MLTNNFKGELLHEAINLLGCLDDSRAHNMSKFIYHLVHNDEVIPEAVALLLGVAFVFTKDIKISNFCAPKLNKIAVIYEGDEIVA